MISVTGIIIVISLLLLILRRTGVEVENVATAVPSTSIKKPVIETRYRDVPGQERSRMKHEVEKIQESLDEMAIRISEARGKLWDQVTEQEMTGDMAVTNELLRRRDEMIDAVAQMNRRNRIVYLIADPGDRQPWIVEVRNDRLILSTDEKGAAGFTKVVANRLEGAEWLLDFYEALEDRDKYYLLLSVKPSGIDLLQEILASVERRDNVARSDVGLDLIPEWAATTTSFPGATP